VEGRAFTAPPPSMLVTSVSYPCPRRSVSPRWASSRDANQASAGRPRTRATSCFPLCDDLAACPECSPDLSSCAGLHPCSAQLGSCCASVSSTGSARHVALRLYHDFAPTRILLTISDFFILGPAWGVLPTPHLSLAG
jgi:hypothetical protein